MHLTETADDEAPNLITHVATTLATTQDVNLTTSMYADLAERDLLPSEHIVDAAYVSSEVIVENRSEHAIEVIGPVPPDTGWQARLIGPLPLDCHASRATASLGQTVSGLVPGHYNGRWPTPGRAKIQNHLTRVGYPVANCLT